jgi:DNA-binding beta-propeller fold protein YncE
LTSLAYQAVAAVVAIVLTLLCSCVNERSLGQVPERYNAYATVEQSGGVAIDVIDMESDSVMRQMPGTGFNLSNYLIGSNDGKYLAVSSSGGGGAKIYDRETETIVGVVGKGAPFICFTPNSTRLIGFGADTTWIFTLPAPELDTALPVKFNRCLPRNNRDNEVIATAFLESEVTGAHREVLLRLDADDLTLLDSFSFESPVMPGGIAVDGATLSPDGNRIYLLGGDKAAGGVFAFDITSHKAVFRTVIQNYSFGEIHVSPDGHEVWVTQSFVTFYSPWPRHLGYVVMYDAIKGLAVDTLRTLGFSLDNPDDPLPVLDMAFHPSGKKAYVAAQSGRPAILVVDTDTKEPVSFIYSAHNEKVFDLTVAPR